LHLSPARPALVDAFDAFCAGPARAAAGVYFLGDLFDAWIGDDQLREPLAAHVAAAMRGVARAGVPVGVIVGNRDFLVGSRFAETAGARLLPEQIVVEVAGTPTLLMHGDELCTGDVRYQRFRVWSRNRERQRRFLLLPYALRHAVGRWMRRQSGVEKAAKSEIIMDVEPAAVEAAFRAAKVTRIIHGHTHRTALHRLVVDGRTCERWVLADWYGRGSYLEVDERGGRMREVVSGDAVLSRRARPTP
jgi:UDP-2,3-diacylglucosamine hydrolase